MRKTRELAGATVCGECGFPQGTHSPDCRQWYQPRHLTEDFEEAGATAQPEPDPDSLDFLTALYAPYASYPSAHIEIRCFPPAWSQVKIRPPREWFPTNEEGIRRASLAVASWRERFDCYMGVLPRVQGGGTAGHLRLCGWLWADVDPGNQGVEEASALFVEAVRKRGLPRPHLVVGSGGGVHVYWRLAEPIPCRTREQQDEIRAVLRRVVRCIGGEEPGAHGCPASTDVARILRVPGTFNHKIEGTPRDVFLSRLSPDEPAFSFVWWKAHLPAEPLPPKPRFRQEFRAQPGQLGRATVEKLLHPAPEGRKHYTMLEVAVAARKRGLDEDGIRALAEQVAAVSGVDVNSPQQARHLDGMVDWTVRNVAPDAF